MTELNKKPAMLLVFGAIVFIAIGVYLDREVINSFNFDILLPEKLVKCKTTIKTRDMDVFDEVSF